MDLREATGFLLHAHDVGNWLRLADTYIQARNKMPESFVLPSDHAVLKPIIEAFAEDTAAFADYIRALRDSASGVPYDELHALYRTVSTRVLQVVRRTRIRKAVTLLLPLLEAELGREISYKEQIDIASALEKAWGAMRVNLMDRERRAFTTKRIPTEERAAILDAFWADLDKKLARSDVPLDTATLSEIINSLKGSK